MDDEYRQWGAKEGGGFNELTLAYKHNPTMENYLALRRAHPDAEIEISAAGGLDTFFRIEPELRKHGFSPSDIAAVLDADPEAISKVALQCMEKLIAAKELAARTDRHSLHPYHGGAEINKALEMSGPSFVSRCEASEVLHSVEAPLDAVAVLVGSFIMGDDDLA